MSDVVCAFCPAAEGTWASTASLVGRAGGGRTVLRVVRLIRRWRSSFDGFDFFFGLVPWMAAYAAFVSWATVIVRAIRGEAVTEDWRAVVSTAAYIGARAMADATEVRESFALRGSVAELRELLRDAARDAEERDRRAAQRERRVYRITVAMAVLAGFTLLAAIGSVIVAFVHG
jgi:hypothetical protein